MKEMRCLSASGQLGHGMPAASFRRGVDKRPAFIGADMGSTDLGPRYLGMGVPAATEKGILRDLGLVLEAGHELGVPLIIGSAGTAGTDGLVDLVFEHARTIARARGIRFRTARIYSEVGKDYVKGKLNEGRVHNMSGVPDLTPDAIEASDHLVAQVGTDAFTQVLANGDADLVIAGRACDTAIYTALPVLNGFDPGLATHMGKIIECSSLCADPGGRDAIIGYLRDDHFDLESQHPERRCTPTSVAAHALYEQADPFRIEEPAGVVDLSEARYEAVDERVTRIRGSRFRPSTTPTLKIEGAGKVGHRCVAIAGVRDPIVIRELDRLTADVARLVADVLGESVPADGYSVRFRFYGLSGVMGPRTPANGPPPDEVGIMVDVIAEDADTAHTVCALVRYNLMHYHYEGMLATAGNLALPFSPPELSAGPVYRFTVYHLVEEPDPGQVVRYRFDTIG